MLATHDTTALDAAIDTEIRAALASLRTELELKLESSTAMAQPQSHPLGSHVHALAIGMVEDLTGFFVAADTLENAAAVTGDDLEDKAQYWWSPSEWGWQYTGGTAPGIVTTEIWALAKGLPEGADDENENREYAALAGLYEERIILCLQRLRGEGELRNVQGEELWVWVHYADASNENIDDTSFARLNDRATAALFGKRWGGGLSAVLEERFAGLQPEGRET